MYPSGGAGVFLAGCLNVPGVGVGLSCSVRRHPGRLSDGLQICSPARPGLIGLETLIMAQS